MTHHPQRTRSWRSSKALLPVKRAIIQLHKAVFYLSPLVRTPQKILPTTIRLFRAWRDGGVADAKALLRRLPYELDFNHIWTRQYLVSFKAEVLEQVQFKIQQWENPPLVSLLLTATDVPLDVLQDAVNSVREQLYPHWELCIVADSSYEKQLQQKLAQAWHNDSRIRLQPLTPKANAAWATNLALGMAKGTISVLLEPAMVLEPQALFRIAECMQADSPDLIYADEAIYAFEAKIVSSSNFRPAFSLEYLRSWPSAPPVIAARTALLLDMGGVNDVLTGAHHYDLMLRLAEKVDTIAHIPEILYVNHQDRVPPNPVRESQLADETRSILLAHLSRCGHGANVRVGVVNNGFDIRYTLQSGQKIAIIIPTKNHGELVRQCIESISRTVKHLPYEIVVIDHASDDALTLAYFEQIKAHHHVLRYQGSFNFSAINNWAVAQLQGPYSHYLFCNNDIEAMEEGWLERMVELGQMPDVGMVGAKLLYPDRRTIQHAGVCVGMYGAAEHYGKFMQNALTDARPNPGYHGSLVANHELSAVTAACALMRRDAFERVGGFDEGLPVGFGDVDLCLKTRAAGYRVLLCAHAVLIHHESFTRGKSREDPHPADTAHFMKKWRNTLNQGDPYYNPNLTLQSTQWEVRQPLTFSLTIHNRVWRRPAHDDRTLQPDTVGSLTCH